MNRFRLKLKRLDFISAVDTPAQETATVVLTKDSIGSAQVTARARVVKTSDELGLVFGWALTSKSNGADYFDLQGDNVVEDDLVRVAAEFMESGGATDQQHDFEQDGRVVFAMPMTAEVAKAFGIDTKTTGLMVAIKPSPDVFAKFKSGEYTGFSIAGVGEREEVAKAGRRVVKAMLYTDEVDGHQHKICVFDDGSMWLEHATSAGASSSHSHGIVQGEGGLVILADSGHSHALAEGLPGVVVVPADAVVVVTDENKAASANSARNSTQPTPTSKVDSMKIVVLSEAQKAHYDTLTGKDAEAFLEKSYAERSADVQKALDADTVVFKGELTGIEVRKSQGDFALKLAKSAEDSEKRARDAANAVAVEKAAREAVELSKRAKETMPNLAGSDEVHCAVLKAVESIADETLRGEAIAALKAANEAARSREVAKGVNAGNPPELATDSSGAYDALEKGLVAYCKANSIPAVKTWTDGLVAYEQTTEGAALKSAYDRAANAAR